MKIIQKEAIDREDAKDFVLASEKRFENKLRETASEIVSRGNRVITLAGPTCSGKTTTAKLLVEEIERRGFRAVVRSIDDFFLSNSRRMGKNGEAPDFDTVKAIDLEYLGAYIRDLLSGKRVSTPVFDFHISSRVGYVEYVPKPNDIYVFEGIQAVYPEVVSLFDTYTSVFICIEEPIIINGVEFLPEEIRLLRRIVRDFNFRNASPEFTILLWESVRRNEIDNIFPNADNPDFTIDSFLPYEPFLLARHVLPLLNNIDPLSPYRDKAERLISRLSALDSSFYGDDIIPAASMFREFIG